MVELLERTVPVGGFGRFSCFQRGRTVLRFLTAGESHGPALTAVIEGLPAGLEISSEQINRDLARRQQGYGRGGRMAIETDRVSILSGVRFGRTLGSPVTLQIVNRDWENWTEAMAIDAPRPHDDATQRRVTKPRPGHADLTGSLKYDHDDVRNVLERASARETAARVAVGAIAKTLLSGLGISVFSQVVSIAGVRADVLGTLGDVPSIEQSPVRCFDPQASRAMCRKLDEIKAEGDSAGGRFRVDAVGVPPGLGSYVSWERRLDAQLTGALMSIPAIKAVEIGLGFRAADLPGSQVHDEMQPPQVRDLTETPCRISMHLPVRKTNNAGGIEGGMSNGEPIWAVVAMKPIPTLYQPLQSFDLETGKAYAAKIERSDVCAVPAAAVVGEAMMAWVLAEAVLEKFGGDSASQLSDSYRRYVDHVSRRLSRE